MFRVSAFPTPLTGLELVLGRALVAKDEAEAKAETEATLWCVGARRKDNESSEGCVASCRPRAYRWPCWLSVNIGRRLAHPLRC